MPSHSTSGSGFSGGRSGGISFSGGRGGFSSGPHSSGGMMVHGPRGPRHYNMFGRTVIISSGGRTGFLFEILMFVILLVATIGLSGMYVNTKDNIHDEVEYKEELVEESNMYKDMITNYYSTTENKYVGDVWASVKQINYGNYKKYSEDFIEKNTGAYYYGNVYYGDEEVEFYFLVYKYTVDGKTYTGETFASYSSDNKMLKDFKEYNSLLFGNANEASIQVIYKLNDPKEAINLDYYVPEGVGTNPNASQVNSEIIESEYLISKYEQRLSTYTTSLIIISVVDAIVVIIFVVSVVVVIKKAKKKSEEEEEIKQQAEEDRAEAKKKVYCMYCGAQLDPDDKKCPNCGSSQTIKK